MNIRIKALLSSLAAVLLTASCTDLNVDVKSQYTEENFPVTQADMEAICGPAYSGFKSAYGRNYWMMVTTTTDEAAMVTNDNNWYDKGYYGQFVLHTWTADNSMTTGSFESLFSCISTCNQILSILGKATASTYRSQAIAEVKTMRALYYFWAMDNFGALPIIDAFGMDTPDRSPRLEVAEFIESELKENLSSLSSTVGSSTYGKPTKYMAMALLAKLYLNWGVYSTTDVSNYVTGNSDSGSNSHLNDAVAYCDSIIASGQYNLTDAWLSKFKSDNGYAIKDFIFAFPYTWTNSDGNLHSRFWGHKYFLYTFAMNKQPSGPIRANPEFVDKFNLAGDVRNKIWRGGLQHYESDTTKTYAVTMSKSTLDAYYSGSDASSDTTWNFTLTKDLTIRGASASVISSNILQLNLGNDELGLAMGYRNAKFYPTVASTSYYQSNDIPIFRYADVLLMKAEAILRGATATNGETAISLVNQIRNCASAPTVTSFTLDQLLDERAREFADEYWRRNDLIRFGQFESDWGLKKASLGTSNSDKYRRIFPIPTSYLQLNTNWTQNTGY